MLTRLCTRIGRAGTRASPLFTSASASASLPRLGLGLSGAASVAAIALYHSEGSAAADAAPPTPPGASRSMMQPPDDADWNRMIMSRLPAVVSIKVNRPRAFDTSSSGTVQATGFVVDKERGLIMTNRHVAGPGPVVAEAIFSNNEEVTLTVAYTDPVHDFALFSFDPSAIKHMELVQLQLAPDEAEVGIDIVIIGNNAGEKSSIHRSTLARLDRNAPAYNRNGYNDFNTFYMHSASGTSGGSSGSPVLNAKGHAIALNAGGKVGTSAGFFLPLDRAARALRLLQSGEPVTRGTVQAVCTHQPFDEARRLGLPAEEEVAIRAAAPDARGILVVSELLPSGPAADEMQPGDIVLRVGGALCTSFVMLEELLDDSIHSEVEVDLCRNGVVKKLSLKVDDLHELTPGRYFEFGGGVVNELSYQQARNHGLPARGVYVAHPGYMLRQGRISRGCIIDAVDGVPTPDLDSFISQMATRHHGDPITVRFYDIAHRSHIKLAALRMDRKWFPAVISQRSDPRMIGDDWTITDLAMPPPRSSTTKAAAAAAPSSSDVTASTTAAAATTSTTTTTTAAEGEDEYSFENMVAAAIKAAGEPEAMKSSSSSKSSSSGSKKKSTPPLNVGALLRPAMVTVDFTRPFSIDGETGMRYRGAGLVLDAEKGIVAVDRNTVTSTLGDVMVTVGDAASVPATVLYVHPVHNFSLVQFDPLQLPKGTPIASAKLDAAASAQVTTGASCWLVGLKSGLNEEFDASRRVDLVARKTRVANTGWIKLPLPNPPRYQLYNVETLGLEVAPSLDGGVIAAPNGHVTALWTSCAYQSAPNQLAQVFRGLPAHHIDAAAKHLLEGKVPPRWHSLGVTLEPLSTAAARRLGVSEDLLPPPAKPPSSATKSENGDGSNGGGGETYEGSSVLCITHIQSNSPARGQLRGGDLLLRVGGQPVRSMQMAEAALQKEGDIDVEIVRDGKPHSLRCSTNAHDGLGTSTVVGWAGLLLQSAPEAVHSQRDLPVGGGVYASYRFFGSPSSRYDLAPTSHIVEVDSIPTPDIPAFLKCTQHKRDGEVLRIKYVDLEGRKRMTTLKLDLKYWPTFLLKRDEKSGEWERTML